MNKSTAALLVAIVALGASLRFYHITEVEPFLSDEAAYHLEARYICSLLSAACESLTLKAEERRTGQDLWKKEQEKKRFTEDLEGRVPWYARPGHLYLVCLAMAVVGPDKVYAGALVSAFFGALCILLIFLLGKVLYGRVAGLVGAALFSLSGVEVLYSRSCVTEEDSLFFFLLAVLCYVANRKAEPERKWFTLVLAGFFMGTCFVIHYRMITYVVALWLLELPFWFKGDRPALRYALQRSLLLAGSVFTPIVLTELPYYLAMLAVHSTFKAALPFTTYVEQLVGQALYLVATYRDAPSTGIAVVNFLTYPYLLWKIEGPAMTLALLIPLIVAFRHRRFEDYLLGTLFLLPFLSCTLFNPRTRYLSGFLAFGILMVASCVQGLWEAPQGARRKLQRAVATLLAMAMLIIGGIYSIEASAPKASYAQAIAFIKDHGAAKHLSTFPLLSQVYCGVKNVPGEWPASEDELRGLYANGYRYFLVDWIKDVIDVVIDQFNLTSKGDKFLAFKRRVDLISQVEARTAPAFTCPNLHVGKLYNLFEINQNFTKTMGYVRTIRENPKATTIRVYDLKEFFEPRT